MRIPEYSKIGKKRVGQLRTVHPIPVYGIIRERDTMIIHGKNQRWKTKAESKNRMLKSSGNKHN